MITMNETFTYLYTHVGIFGSLPTHKVFTSDKSNRTKLIFADNTFIYSLISSWALTNSDFDSGKAMWKEEPADYLENEIKKLAIYKANHPLFVTES